jgi:hypothetical protein
MNRKTSPGLAHRFHALSDAFGFSSSRLGVVRLTLGIVSAHTYILEASFYSTYQKRQSGRAGWCRDSRCILSCRRHPKQASAHLERIARYGLCQSDNSYDIVASVLCILGLPPEEWHLWTKSEHAHLFHHLAQHRSRATSADFTYLPQQSPIWIHRAIRDSCRLRSLSVLL